MDLDAASMDQRTRLLNGTDRLAESSRRLQDSHKIALETEQLGAGILTDLRGQREQIIHTRNTVMKLAGKLYFAFLEMGLFYTLEYL
ncbi:hypothetical protein BX616_007644 [Lobosporangium transversale]|nr:hypothetical protein BX616_007644 [Lobosporangium transversale]